MKKDDPPPLGPYISTARAQPWKPGKPWQEMDEPNTHVIVPRAPRPSPPSETRTPATTSGDTTPPPAAAKQASGTTMLPPARPIGSRAAAPPNPPPLENKPRSRRVTTRTREIVWNRDRGACVSCGTTSELHFDHIIPFSLGGSSEPENIQLLCSGCNLEKGARIR